MFYIMMFMLMLGIIMFCMMHKHLLQTLLILEFLVLIMFLMMFFMILIMGYEMYYSLLFLIFTVCEGALGLSILVNLVRNQGNDFISSMSVLSW
uniref:NADH dehydrogenase subunit 4L n=1 Tax=Tessaromerus quadriarticulatus TaxID=3020145 RepID=UPI0024114FB3|nr:NADH dehydrogenase subunit 4L [Tessaromerus quadriarticulatus]WEM32420.1 NADH dehydrogenase subunit 4L [Tessaromerus quadriarticulatus]